MNKIYKVIWSKVKHQYVVTSEFAHSCTKSTTSRVGKSALAALAAFVLTAGVGGVQAASEEYLPVDEYPSIGTKAELTTENVQNVLENEDLTLDNITANSGSIAGVGFDNHTVTATNLNSTTLQVSGGSVLEGSLQVKDTTQLRDLKVGGANGVANATISEDGKVTAKSAEVGGVTFENQKMTVDGQEVDLAKVADTSVTVQENADKLAAYEAAGIEAGEIKSSSRSGSIAIGTGAKILERSANSTVLGDGAEIHKYAENATAIGQGATVGTNAAGSTAIGQGSQVSSGITNAVALGHNSVAYESDTVSVGNSAKGLTRKITNVKDGENLTDAVNVKQLNTKTANMVEWDPILDDEGNPTGAYTENTIRGVILDNGTINAANGGDIGGLHVDTAGTMWEKKRDGSFGLMYSEGNLELSGALTAANGAVKIHDNGIVQAGDKILLNSSMGQVIANSVGANDVTTQSFTAGNGKVKVDKDGKLSTTGEVLMQNGKGESLAMTDGGLSLMSTDNGTGMVTVANGKVNLMGGGNTTVTVDGNGTTFGTLTSDAKTTISGGSITTGSLTVDSLTAANGAVKIHDNGIVQAGDKILLNSSMGQVIANSVGANDVTTQSFTAGNGKVKVDKDGKLSTTGEVLMQNGKGESLAMTDGGLSLMSTDNGTGMVTVANGKVNLMGGGNTTVTVDGNGTTFGTLTSDAKTTISGGSITTGSLTVDSLTAANGAVKIHDNGIVQAGDKILLNSSMGQVIANSVGANDVTTQSFTAGNGKVKVDKDGKLSTTGEVLMQNGKGESLAMTDGGLSLMSTDNGTGMVTVANGKVNLMGGGNTTVTVDGNGTTFGTLTGDAKTTISGGSITGLTNQKWNGKTDDESRAATEGQLADLSEDLNTSIDTATKGVVKWDDADQDSIHGVGLEEGGHLTATTISAKNGHFTVDEAGLTMTRSNGQDVFTVDENGAVTAAGGLFKISDGGAVSGKTMNGTFFNMDDNGIMMGLTADDGQTPGTTVQVTNNGVLFTDGKSEMGTTINGNTIHTGSITATGTSTLGDVKIGEGLVDGVDVSELDTTVGELDKNAVKWDDADEDSIHGVGLEEGGYLTATTISAKNGHFTVDEAGLTMTRSNGQDAYCR